MAAERKNRVPQTAFERILEKGSRAGILPARERSARRWYREKSRRVRVAPRRIMRETRDRQVTRLRGLSMLGNMYCFFYDPKMEETLAYYDTFPLVIPIKSYADGFLGINMHYLHPRLRARLMDALYLTVNNEEFDETTKMRRQLISYNMLESFAKYKYFRPCLKRYLTNHVRSRYLKIEPTEWDVALFLPTERFKKERRETVWRESTENIKNAV